MSTSTLETIPEILPKSSSDPGVSGVPTVTDKKPLAKISLKQPIQPLKPMSPIRPIKPVPKKITTKTPAKTKTTAKTTTKTTAKTTTKTTARTRGRTTAKTTKTPEKTKAVKIAKQTKDKIPKKTPIIIPNCQNHLMEQFKKFFEANSIEFNGTNQDLAKRTEKAIHEYVKNQARALNIDTTWNPKFQELYLSKGRSILTNLNPKSYLTHQNQANLLEQFIKGELDPVQLVKMTPQELAPKKWQKFVELRTHEAKIHSQHLSIGTTDLFKCGKCKQKKCTYSQQQTRSQDEPATTFITCTFCGNHWRE